MMKAVFDYESGMYTYYPREVPKYNPSEILNKENGRCYCIDCQGLKTDCPPCDICSVTFCKDLMHENSLSCKICFFLKEKLTHCEACGVGLLNLCNFKQCDYCSVIGLLCKNCLPDGWSGSCHEDYNIDIRHSRPFIMRFRILDHNGEWTWSDTKVVED